MQKAKNSQMKRKPRNQTKTTSTVRLLRKITSGPQFLGQTRKRMNLPGAPIILSTTIAGLINTSTALSPAALVTAFVTRFGAAFSSYRVLGIRLRVRPLSVSTGVTKFYFANGEDAQAGSDTLNMAKERQGVVQPNNSNDPKATFQMLYVTKSIEEMAYGPTSSGPAVPAYFNVYTDAADYGAPAAVTPLWLLEPTFSVEFMGLASS